MPRITKPHTTKADIEAHKLEAALCYLFLPLPLLIARRSTFVRFHLNQGISLLFMTGLGVGVTYLFSFVVDNPVLVPIGTVLVLLIPAYILLVSGLWLLALSSVMRGNMRRLPIVGQHDYFKLK